MVLRLEYSPSNQEVSGSILGWRQDFFFLLFSEALSLFVGFIVIFIVTFMNSTVFPTMNSTMDTLDIKDVLQRHNINNVEIDRKNPWKKLTINSSDTRRDIA